MGFAKMFFSVVSAVGIRMQIQMRIFVSHDFLLFMATVFGIWITTRAKGRTNSASQLSELRER